MSPFLKWPGGKTLELTAIAAAAPALDGRFIDPFVGGGSVLLAIPAAIPAEVNDACRDLVELYTSAAAGDPAFRMSIEGLAGAWDDLTGLDALYAELALAEQAPDDDGAATLADHRGALGRVLVQAGPDLGAAFEDRVARELRAKLMRIRRLEARHGALSAADRLANVEGAVRASVYMSVRARYNAARLAGRWDAIRGADFLFLREYAYAAMFRFNRRDEFNVPYGGISYNRKSLAEKGRLLFSPAMLARLASTAFHHQDFEPFLAACAPTADDFVFVDPPYDSDFSAYDNRAFDAADQVRLERVLGTLRAKVMVVIKDAPAIRTLYSPDRWNVIEAPKTYMWTIKSRNDRLATHLTITNYPGLVASG
ncbi:MAG TPA: DNA adenine methylase [Solirubrobacteraceae bacterium]|nr:DNA adenine methylase [Solirubrobacteraceae bacterium]